MPSILVENDSRVRETACFMRLKKPDLGASSGADSGAGEGVSSGVSFLPPKNLIMRESQI